MEGSSMKKQIIYGLVAGTILGVTGCENSNQLKAENESLSVQVESLSSELETLKSEKDKSDAELASIKESIEAAKKEAELQTEDVTVVVIDKSELPEDIHNGRYNDYCTLKFQITNNTDKDIQGVEGRLYVRDLFGKDIANFGCDFTGQTVPVGQSVTNDSMALEVNPFMDEHTKFYNTAFADLKFEFKVSQIVFTDGSVKK